MKNQYIPTIKDEILSLQEKLRQVPLKYSKEINYEDLQPSDVPVKAYWLNWSTTT
jgi:hypothetical protein